MNEFKATIIKILKRILPDRAKNSLLHLSFHLARSEFDRFAYEFSFTPNMEFGLAAAAKLGLFCQRQLLTLAHMRGNGAKWLAAYGPTAAY